MKILLSSLKSQKGAATLLTSVILLIAITLVVMLSAKTVLNETKIAASNYRISQANAAANYAMDFAIDYFDSGGFDQNLDDIVDNIHTFDTDGDATNGNEEVRLTSSDGSQTTFATISFTPDATTWKSGLITATGFSDDRGATRTITQRVGPLGILINDGPSQPLVAQGNIALTGNARIINRFTNTTIWSGGDVKISSSSAMETYIKDPAVGTLDPSDATDLARLLQIDEDIDTQLVSNNTLGNGLDIIDDDPSLGTLVGIEFFKNFFESETRDQLKIKAEPQVYTSMADAITIPVKTGLIWVEEADGSQTMNGGTIGSIAKPAIVYINGDFTLAGNSIIYGVLYVAGKYTIGGNPVVVGANVVEGTNLATETPASPPVVTGTGTISLVYWQGILSDKKNPMDGQTAVISGSWRDW
ncbi:MAG: hypothetical protein GQ532_10425 [Methylomarinum sp.]|nr:hypothetical protein [Methylomarinum sp.]